MIKRELLSLEHALDEGIDLVFTVAALSTLNKVSCLLALESASGVRELERPEEGIGLLESGANSDQSVDQILNTNDSELTKGLLNDGIVSNGNALLVDLGESSLVNELTDRLEVGVSPGNVGSDPLEHLESGLVQANEGTRVDLGQTEELQDLAGLGGKLVNTLQSNDKGELGLLGNVEGALGLGSTSKTDHVTFLGAVLLDIGLGTLEDDLSLGLVVLLNMRSMVCEFSNSTEDCPSCQVYTDPTHTNTTAIAKSQSRKMVN